MSNKPSNPSRCCICNKLEFYCEYEAYEYANWLQQRHDFYIRVYYSDLCGCYHFTSRG